MRHYTVLTGAGIRWLAPLLLAALLSACAGEHPPHAGQPAAPTPKAAAKVAAGTPSARPAHGKAQSAKPSPDRPRIRPHVAYEYTVKKGDTLWGIASHFLKNPWAWPRIWYENPHIHNPHWIYPGDVLRLTDVNGRPRLEVITRVVRLEPHVRVEALHKPIPVVPMSVIRAFLRGPRIVSRKTLAHAPYVLATAGGQPLGATGMDIYVRHLPASGPDKLAVVHPGQLFKNPLTGAVLGRQVDHVADARVLKRGQTARLVLTHSLRATHVGDRLLPELAHRLADFYPRAPHRPVSGHIIADFGNTPAIGRYDIVTLDRGRHSGLQRGDVLSIYQSGRRVRDPYSHHLVQLPSRRAGLVMVFRVYPHLSYALVMKSLRSIHVGDQVTSPKAHASAG